MAPSAFSCLVNQEHREEPVIKTKPYCISKKVVFEAWLRVKANKGAAGVDGASIAQFERRLKDNLYKVWNRMSSGTYFPPPVRRVMIPKADGGERPLGIPTVGDRVAQMVVKRYLEPEVEPQFHPDSYGYRPHKSAIDAVGQARQRCWRNDWVLDLDIRGFFDNIDHALMMRAVRKHTDCKWILLYVERWLNAPVVDEDGIEHRREKGTPQGGVISPLLANILLHHAFDMWMAQDYPRIPFERYADDIVVHCRSKSQAQFLQRTIKERLRRCKLELHPDKTKIVYCKDGNRPDDHASTSFDFLGYTFRPRRSENWRGEYFVSFSPAISAKAAKRIRATMAEWRIHHKTYRNLEEIAEHINSTLRGWIAYYGKFHKSALYATFRCLNSRLVKWVQRKYKKRARQRRAWKWLRRIARKEPRLFAHWQLGALP